VKIILGHTGLFQHWREAIAALGAAENLWGCLCGPYPAALREVIRRCDRLLLLWGSDFGFGFADAVGYRLGLMDCLDLREEEKCEILEDNPRRLFALPAP
jgi:predicted TIM-barrel fold metal-dependent hydrolase